MDAVTDPLDGAFSEEDQNAVLKKLAQDRAGELLAWVKTLESTIEYVAERGGDPQEAVDAFAKMFDGIAASLRAYGRKMYGGDAAT